MPSFIVEKSLNSVKTFWLEQEKLIKEIHRIPEWSEKIKINFPVEIFPYTEKEINHPIVQEAMKEGIILFER